MDRSTRDRFAALTPQKDLLYGKPACQETPKEVFGALDRRYHFDVDLFANEQNALSPAYFGAGGLYADALQAPWFAGHVPGSEPYQKGWGRSCGFANPPYGPFIMKALQKALVEQANGFTSVFLLPLRASKWYRNLVLPYYTELWHVEQRLLFTYLGEPSRDAKGQPCSSLFDSIIVVFAPRPQTWLPGFPPQRPNVWNAKTGELKY